METPMSTEGAAHYLAAMIDGEGHVLYSRAPQLRKGVRITSTDYELVEAVVEACAVLGIVCRVRAVKNTPPRRQAWEVGIHRNEALGRLAEVVPIRHRTKRDRLLKGLAASRPTRTRPPRALLEQLYVFEGRTVRSLAVQFSVRDETVSAWLMHYDIPRRSRGEAIRLGWEERRGNA